MGQDGRRNCTDALITCHSSAKLRRHVATRMDMAFTVEAEAEKCSSWWPLEKHLGMVALAIDVNEEKYCVPGD